VISGLLRRPRSVAGAALSLSLLIMLAACGDFSGPSDGSGISICGVNIGQAAEGSSGNGPFYVDATQSSVGPVDAVAGTNPINVRVSQNCSVGARLVVSNPKVIKLQTQIKATNGTVEVVAVLPLKPGQSTLTAFQRGVSPISVTFVIRPSPAT
jgi:hypothetical protein